MPTPPRRAGLGAGCPELLSKYGFAYPLLHNRGQLGLILTDEQLEWKRTFREFFLEQMKTKAADRDNRS
jgi:hypothetical protein